MEDFAQLTIEDRNSLAYKACVASTAIIGMAVGSLTRNTLGVVAVGLAGAAIGTQICPWVKNAFLEKIKNGLMTDLQFGEMMNDLSSQFPNKDRNQLLVLSNLVIANIKNGAFERRS